MKIDQNKIMKAVVILLALFIGVFGLTQLIQKNSITLSEYAKQNPPSNASDNEHESERDSTETDDGRAELSETGIAETEPLPTEENATENLQIEGTEDTIAPISTLTGALLNTEIPEEQRISYTKSFYYEPLSDNLKRYITGVSFPAITATDGESSEESEPSGTEEIAITYDELRYVHILHYDFDGNLAEGELICNEYIAQDLVEIFHELYLNEYQLEKILLIDEYNGDDVASMEDNNTSCFNYRVVAGSTSLSKHALGLAIDVNPLYNPYITYTEDGGENVSPEGAVAYADRDASFPYKIDENDLCYKLFTEHGFTWGGNWNSCKDYQHFQKVIPKDSVKIISQIQF